MSESESELSSVSSNGTLEAMDFEHVLQNLIDAAQDALESKDFLSYSTVLDIHLSEPCRYSTEEKEELLQLLLDTLGSNHSLVYEVGWDIPALLVPMIDSEFDFQGPIRSAPGVYKILKIFEILALYGNAKELFLKATELLSGLTVAGGNGNPAYKFKFFEVKLYCVVELVTSTLRRIETLYPSRFLAMSVSSMVNALYVNQPPDANGFSFIMKRLYGFARNYSAPPKPKTTAATQECLAKIEDDENFLQRKLLTALVTEGVYQSLRHEMIGFTVSYFNHVHRVLSADKSPTSDFTLDVPVMVRLHELALSFDLCPEAEFETFAASTEHLIDFKASEALSEETYSGELFERLVIDFQDVFANCIISTKTGAVSDSLGGQILLYTYECSASNASGCVDVALKQAISIAIRLLVPGMVHRSLYHRGLSDVAVFWCWYAVHKIAKTPKALELELSSIPKSILSTFLQSLLHSISFVGPQSQYRYSTLTLLTKILSTAPEASAYAFIINALRDCPFRSAIPVLVSMLRVLVTSDRKADELGDKLNSLSLGDNPTTGKAPPPLPARTHVEKSKFITLTEDRFEDILSVVDQYIDSTFAEVDGSPSVNFEHLPTLSGLLNLLIPLRQSPFAKADRIVKIITVTENKISAVEKAHEEDAEKSISLNAVTVLRVALTRLAE